MNQDPNKANDLNSDSEPQRLEPESTISRFADSENLITLISDDTPLNPNRLEDNWIDNNQQTTVKQKKFIVSSGAICILSIILIFAAYYLYRNSQKNSETHAEMPEILDLEDQIQEAAALSSLKNEQITSLIANYYSAKNPDELLKYCFDDGTLKSKLHTYYTIRKMPLVHSKPMNHHVLHTQAHGELTSTLCKVFLDDSNIRILNIKETKLGPRVDWEFSVCWQSTEWPDLLNDRSIGVITEQRVQIHENTAYLAGYQEDEYHTVRIKSPNLDYEIYAYIKKSADCAPFFDQVINSWKLGIKINPSIIITLKPVSLTNNILVCEVDALISKSWFK